MLSMEEKSTSVEKVSFALEDSTYHKARWTASPAHLQDAMKAGLTEEDAQFLYEIPKEEQDKIFSKVDWRLCPMLAVLYLISHLDRLVGPIDVEKAPC